MQKRCEPGGHNRSKGCQPSRGEDKVKRKVKLDIKRDTRQIILQSRRNARKVGKDKRDTDAHKGTQIGYKQRKLRKVCKRICAKRSKKKLPFANRNTGKNETRKQLDRIQRK